MIHLTQDSWNSQFHRQNIGVGKGRTGGVVEKQEHSETGRCEGCSTLSMYLVPQNCTFKKKS